MTISELFDYGDEIAVTGESPWLDPEEIKEMTMKRIHSQPQTAPRGRVLRRTGRTLLFAAVIASLLTVTAVAAGLSIHQKRQSQLRRELGIDQNHVSDYVEAPLPAGSEEPEPGATLLSTVNDGEFQRVFVNVSPVEPEVIEHFGSTWENADGSSWYYEFSFTGDGEHFGIAMPIVLTDGSGSAAAGTLAQLLASAYDEETGTLTLECDCFNTMFDFTRPYDLTLSLYKMTRQDTDTLPEEIRSFGTVTVTPTQAEGRSIRFDQPVPFENPATGGRGQVIGMELRSMSVELLLEHDDMETLYAPCQLEGEAQKAFFEEQTAWLNALNALEQSLVLTYADGRTQSGLAGMRSWYEDGLVHSYLGLGTGSIDIDAVTSVSIGGVVRTLS